VWQAVTLSVQVALWSTGIALVLGTLAAGALARFSFFGRDAISLLLILPIALPGVVTGIALRSAYHAADIPFSFWTIVIGHATFCVVVVYNMVFNNVFARLRRMNPNLQEASADLGAGLWQTFRLVTFPQFRTSFAAGALLAFALSFDEVVVTIFTAPPGIDTLPLWILKEVGRPNQASVVNVVATVVILLSLIPVYISQRLARAQEEER